MGFRYVSDGSRVGALAVVRALLTTCATLATGLTHGLLLDFLDSLVSHTA